MVGPPLQPPHFLCAPGQSRRLKRILAHAALVAGIVAVDWRRQFGSNDASTREKRSESSLVRSVNNKIPRLPALPVRLLRTALFGLRHPDAVQGGRRRHPTKNANANTLQVLLLAKDTVYAVWSSITAQPFGSMPRSIDSYKA